MKKVSKNSDEKAVENQIFSYFVENKSNECKDLLEQS
jgi:hypothetical protein